MSDDQTFWSRRRAAVAAEEAAEGAAARAELDAQAVEAQQAELKELSDEEILIKLDLPDPDTLKQGDDFKGFLAKAVPEHLRRRALRTLWRSNPVLANVDMLVDYGEDFTDAATVIENMQTTYQVGKGMLKHIEEMARQAEEAENPAPVAEELEDEGNEEVLLTELDSEELDAKALEYQEYSFEDDTEDMTELATSRPRRMKFRAEEAAA